MAFKVEKGQTVSLSEAKSGEGQRGIWMFVPVKAEKGYDRITLWVNNAEEARYFTGEATIKDITGVSISHTQSKDKTKWYDQYAANVTLDGKNGNRETANKGLSAFDDFMQMPDGDGLPFK